METPATVELPAPEVGPLGKILRRLVIAIVLVCFVAFLAYFGRDGYMDPEDSSISLLDAFYYSTVTITTTGYGDIRPVTDGARAITTFVVTPARVLFLILLVGTTLEVLAEHSRRAFRRGLWRRGLRDHVIVCGYGTKGRSAIKALSASGLDTARIVVIDPYEEARRRATAAGFATIGGTASSSEVLEEAGVRDARAVIVAVDRDDAAVLITLTTRELAPETMVVAAVREEENVHLLRQSGADSVITSSAAAGRLLGLAAESPRVTEVLEDLLTVGEGLDVAEREITEEEAGPVRTSDGRGPIVAVVRDGEVFRFDDERAERLLPGDRVVELRSHRA